MTHFETVDLEFNKTSNIATLYLNRPNQLNALNEQLTDDICSAIKEISTTESIRCLIIAGRGKAFCAGGDLVEFGKIEKPEEYMHGLAIRFNEGIKTLKSLNSPSIAAVHGSCFGVGLSIACACDLRACSEDAKFALAFTNVGLSPDSSLTFHLPKIVGLPIANEMAILNRILNAEDAKKYNLVSQIINSKESFMEEIYKIAIKISQGPTLAFGSTKKLFVRSFSNDLNAHLEEELENFKKNAATGDFREALSSFAEKRKPNFKGK